MNGSAGSSSSASPLPKKSNNNHVKIIQFTEDQEGDELFS